MYETRRTINTTSLEASQFFDVHWLYRHTKPHEVICGKGSEFKLEFKELCETHAIMRVPFSRRKPQSNAIIERTHLVLLNVLRAPPSSDVTWKDED